MKSLIFGVLLLLQTSATPPNPPQSQSQAQQAEKQQPQRFELNTALMNSTYLLTTQVSGVATMGTGFILGRPFPHDASQARMVLVTAAHVLNGMPGENIFIIMRRKVGPTWQLVPTPFPIRHDGRPLWVQHQSADVAAMYINLPPDLKPEGLVSTDLLANDKLLTDYEIHPGDELNVLGYPLGVTSNGGFPVLRSGKIASYPLVPVKENPYFLLDFRIFKGNSGGPVYLINNGRTYGGAMNIVTIQLIMGLVSEELGYVEQTQGIYENSVKTKPLGLAKIVPAAYIAETINLLSPVE